MKRYLLDLKAETDGKSLVDAMTASAAAAKKACARRRPSPAGVPGAPGGSFIRTPRGCAAPSPSPRACAAAAGAGGGASTGCTAGRLARIARSAAARRHLISSEDGGIGNRGSRVLGGSLWYGGGVFFLDKWMGDPIIRPSKGDEEYTTAVSLSLYTSSVTVTAFPKYSLQSCLVLISFLQNEHNSIFICI